MDANFALLSIVRFRQFAFFSFDEWCHLESGRFLTHAVIHRIELSPQIGPFSNKKKILLHNPAYLLVVLVSRLLIVVLTLDVQRVANE